MPAYGAIFPFPQQQFADSWGRIVDIITSMIGSIQTAAPKQSHARRAVAFYFLAYTGLGASMAIVGPTLPALGHNTSTALAALSVILVTRSVGHLSGSLLGGWFYDHYRGHPVMAGALVVGAIAIAAVPGIVNVWLLAAVFFFVGVAVNVLDVGGNTLLIWFFGSKSGPYINALHFSFGIGALIAPLVVVQIVQWTGTIDWAYRLLGLWILLPVVFLLRLRSPRNLKSEPGGGDASQNKKNIVLMGLFALLFLFCLGSEMSFGDWIYSYGVETGMENEVSAGVLTSAFWAFLTFGRLLGIPVAARVRPRVILLVDLVGMVGCLTVLSLWGAARLSYGVERFCWVW